MTRLTTLTLITMLGLSSCATSERHDDEAACKEPKPGVITTLNSYCPVMPEDTVDPSVAPVEWKGVKYGLCCPSCRADWAKLTDAQKDAAAAKVTPGK